ncbi:MAG: universal stress protein [Chloroflexales bacterium]|nr:universal stress protein [Chloroflexales bacterium]
MYRAIMVPLDGSAFGEHALPLALGIARRTCAQVHLVHVRTPAAEAPAPEDHGTGEQASTAIDQERIAVYLRELATYLSERWEIVIKASSLEGPVAETLQAYVQASGIDLTIMTTHGYGPLSRIWMGSVADSLVRRLSSPTVLVRPHAEAVDLLETVHEQAFEHILIPLDGSKLAESIIEPAIELGALMEARYTLLQAIEPLIKGYIPGPYAGLMDKDLREPRRAETKAYLERIAHRMREQGLRVETQTPIAYAPDAILDYARDYAVDFIAMATHGRSGFSRVLMGSIASTVVCKAGVPILLYRPSAEALQNSAANEDHLVESTMSG